MADEPIPEDVRNFILRHIDSVTQLEALLLLRANPAATWDIPKTAQRLYVSDQEVINVLTGLCEDGLVNVSDGIYRYDCPSAELSKLVERLASTYSRHLISVTNMIHAKPRGIRQFADAFKFRRNP